MTRPDPLRAITLVPGNNPADPGGRFLSVRQLAEYLQVNEKKIYTLVAEGLIPGTKITGKWLFPRELVDQWLLEASHGGVLTDRLLVAGGDDPLLRRIFRRLAEETDAKALLSYSATGTRLGLRLLAARRADACAIHWGPSRESAIRHPALLHRYDEHRDWVIVRCFEREQGILLARELEVQAPSPETLLRGDFRWAMRREESGTQRMLQDWAAHFELELSALTIGTTALDDREAASALCTGVADLAPASRAVAREFGLPFLSTGWEAFDLVVSRKIYFRTLFQRLLETLRGTETRKLAERLSGYDLREAGTIIESRHE